jgi:hypothetical protein
MFCTKATQDTSPHALCSIRPTQNPHAEHAEHVLTAIETLAASLIPAVRSTHPEQLYFSRSYRYGSIGSRDADQAADTGDSSPSASACQTIQRAWLCRCDICGRVRIMLNDGGPGCPGVRWLKQHRQQQRHQQKQEGQQRQMNLALNPLASDVFYSAELRHDAFPAPVASVFSSAFCSKF